MKQLQKEIASNLRWAAAGYARAGMGLMLASTGLGRNAQAAVGNLAIATELLLKAFIANQDLTLLFKDLPVELRCVRKLKRDSDHLNLIHNEDVPNKSFQLMTQMPPLNSSLRLKKNLLAKSTCDRTRYEQRSSEI